jgi:amino acid permease
MENAIDHLLENIFGGIGSQINIMFGILLLAVGIIMLAVAVKKQSSKGKRIAALVCIGIGGIGVLSGLARMMLT